MFLYSKISCRVIGKALYNSTFKGRENGPLTGFYEKMKMLLQNGFKPNVEGCVNVPKKRVMLCGKTGRNGWWESFRLEDVVQVLNSKIS